MKLKGNILLVDDNEDIIAVLSDYLTSRGYNIEVAFDGEEALKKYKKGKFDLLISDVVMPNMNGIELMQHIYKIDEEIIIVMISGYPNVNKAVEAMKAGAYDYIIKPFELEDVHIRIKRAFEKKIMRQQMKYSRGLAWALFISIPLWLGMGIFLALLLR